MQYCIENEYHVIELERTSALNARVRLATNRIERTFARFNGPAVHVGGVGVGCSTPTSENPSIGLKADARRKGVLLWF